MLHDLRDGVLADISAVDRPAAARDPALDARQDHTHFRRLRAPSLLPGVHSFSSVLHLYLKYKFMYGMCIRDKYLFTS